MQYKLLTAIQRATTEVTLCIIAKSDTVDLNGELKVRPCVWPVVSLILTQNRGQWNGYGTTLMEVALSKGRVGEGVGEGVGEVVDALLLKGVKWTTRHVSRNDTWAQKHIQASYYIKTNK